MKTLHESITLSSDKKEMALAVQEQLNTYKVGFGEEKKFMSLVSPEPFLINQEELDILTHRGDIIREWIETTNRIYHLSLNNESMFWLRDLLETGLNPDMVNMHRKLHSTKPMRPPLFVRMDQPDFNISAEAQTPGSGWGYHAALAMCYPDHNLIGRHFVANVAKHLRQLSGRDTPKILHLLHKDEFYGSEAEFFARCIRLSGIDFHISVRKIPHDIESYDIVLRHYLDELDQYDGWPRLMELYIANQLEIEPAPNIMTDHKIAMMLPFHPQTFHFYSNAVRTLFPTTYLVDPYATYIINIEGKKQYLRLSDLPGIANKKRKLVLKYAGMHFKKRAGGRGVFNLAMSSTIVSKGLIQNAINDTYNGEPWLIQDMVLRRFPITYLNTVGKIATDNLFARINPFYAFPTKGGSELLGCPVHFRNFWKVHGQEDAVETILSTS